MDPALVAERMFDALREERLHILTHPDSVREVRARFRLILGEDDELKSP
jgi:hypothetical protein